MNVTRYRFDPTPPVTIRSMSGLSTVMNALIAGHKDIADKVEMLPAKFMTTDFYVAFAKPYYTAHKAQVDALWGAIGKVRKSKEYQDAIKDIK